MQELPMHCGRWDGRQEQLHFWGIALSVCLLLQQRISSMGKHRQRSRQLLMMYTGAGVILGHNFPFYMKFKGGKGIAATAGLIISTLSLPMVLVCLVAFVGIVGVTRYVSLGSLAIVVIYLVEIIICGQTGRFRWSWRICMRCMWWRYV